MWGNVNYWWGCKPVQKVRRQTDRQKTIWSFFNKLKIKLPHDLGVSLLGIYQKEMKSLSQRDVYTSMYTEILFIIMELWKKSRCSLTDEWLECGVYMYIYIIHNRILFILTKKELLPWIMMDKPEGYYAMWNKPDTE